MRALLALPFCGLVCCLLKLTSGSAVCRYREFLKMPNAFVAGLVSATIYFFTGVFARFSLVRLSSYALQVMETETTFVTLLVLVLMAGPSLLQEVR